MPVASADRKRAVYAFFLFATFMASYYVFKPVRGSLYLHYLGPDNLPYAYLMSTLVALVGMSIYNRIYLLLDARRVFSVSVIALSASAVLFYVAEAAELISSGLFSFLFFLWVSLQGTLSATLSWCCPAASGIH